MPGCLRCMSELFPILPILATLRVLFFHCLFPVGLNAADVSAPPLLQFYEARWATIEDRTSDIFASGYGGLWLPPPQRADTGAFSVGYDVFDRFHLGQPRNETLYGTETGLKTAIAVADRASVNVYTDFIPNHNGFGNRTDPNFVALGGYPGFALTLPGVDVEGDFHSPFIDFGQDPFNGPLAGLIDIAHEKNHQFIRSPVGEGDPDNIPSGSLFNKPDPTNARFYTDRDLGGLSVFDPRQGTNVTLYDFNPANPLEGDAVMETTVDLLKRNARWMIQEIGVDGFRVDAAKHFSTDVLEELDQAVFRANTRRQHDGSIKPVYLFSETLDEGHALAAIM